MRCLLYFCFIFLTFSCKNDSNKAIDKATNLSVAEKIAKAHGIEHWKQVSKIEFTFNVDQDTSHYERKWIWEPKNNKVTINSGEETVFSYNTNTIDSLSIRTDQGFINDKFWLLAPFHLVWDDGVTISEPTKDSTLIGKMPAHKITLLYGKKGGYTPGDAYDFYYDDDYLIKEWVYRKENTNAPSLVTTWEDYKNFNGLKIATTHKRAEGNWNLNFTNIKVITDSF